MLWFINQKSLETQVHITMSNTAEKKNLLFCMDV